MAREKRVSYRVPGLWDINTHLSVADDGQESITAERATMAVLYVIRDELKQLNALLSCSRFIAIPTKLDKIERNTRKAKKKSVAKKKV